MSCFEPSLGTALQNKITPLFCGTHADKEKKAPVSYISAIIEEMCPSFEEEVQRFRFSDLEKRLSGSNLEQDISVSTCQRRST